MNWNERKNYLLFKLKNGQYKQLWYLVKRRIIFSLIMKPIGIPIAILVIPSIYILRPVIRINLFSIPTGRLGHLALEPEMYLRRKKLTNKSKRSFDIFFTSRSRQGGVIANKQILKMLKRNMVIFDSYLASWIFYSMEWLLLHTDIKGELPHDENVETDSILKKVDSTFLFVKSEIEKGNAELQSMGIDPEKDWFVLIFARDNAYLSKTYPDCDWGYHDWRNADINTYIEAVKYILDQGGYVLRMGSVINADMDFSHPRYIDYARKYRNDFMDIFLVSRCKFLLGTNAGLADVAIVFDKPRAIVNVIPLGYVPHGRDNVYIPKKYMNHSSKKYLPLKFVLETHRDTIFDQESFLGEDYSCVDNSTEDILEITMELMSRLNGKFFLSNKQKNLMRKYKDLFSQGNMSYDMENPIGMNFLEKNKDWIFGLSS